MNAEMIRYLGITVEFPVWATGHAGTTKRCNSALLCVLLVACILLVPFATSAAGIPDADTLLQFNERLRTNDVAGVRAMLDEGIDPEIIDNDVRQTPLMKAAHHGHVEMLGLLLQRGADIHRKDIHGRTALGAAISNHKAEAARFLLSRGARFRDLWHGGSVHDLGFKQDLPDDAASALQLAVSARNVELLDQLLESGADINLQDNRTGWTALMYAVSLGYPQMVKVLLKRGASIHIKDKNGLSAIDFCLHRYRPPDARPDIATIMAVLLDAGLRPQERQVFSFFMFAIDQADTQLLEQLVNRLGPDSPPGADDSPLHHALWAHKPDIVTWLLRHGADTEWRDREGKTAITSVLRDPVLFEILRSHGADLDTRDNFGHGLLWHLMREEHPNPAIFSTLLDAASSVGELRAEGGRYLYEAVLKDNPELVRILLDKGVDPDYEYADASGRLFTPLALAINVNHAMAMQLLAAGADPNHLTPDTNSFLVRAVGLADVPLTSALLKAGAEVNQASQLTGKTALQTAIIHLPKKPILLAPLLLEAGARADYGDPRLNDQMISDACASGDITLVRALIDAGARLNPSDSTLLPPLASAAVKNSVDIMSLLLDKGARVNAEHYVRDIWHVKQDNGTGPTADRTLVDMHETALLKSARMNNLNAMKLLIRSGADVGVELHSGISALQVAIDGGQHELDVRSALHKRQYSEKLAARNREEGLVDEFARETKLPGNLPVMNTLGDCVSVECVSDPLRETGHQQTLASSNERHEKPDAVKVLQQRSNGTLVENPVDVIDLKPVVIVESVEEYGARKLGYEQQLIHERFNHYQPQMIAALLNAGADLDRQDTVFGMTPLMQAIKAGRAEAVKLLVEAGARLDIKDHKGHTAADYATAAVDSVGMLAILKKSR